MKHNRIRNLWVLSFLILLGLSFSMRPVSAQENLNLNMQAYASFEGNFKYGEWLPINVTLENNGADLETVLQATINQTNGNVTFAKRVSLPTGSRKQVTLYILPNNFSREIEIQLHSEDELLTTQTVEVSPNQNDALVVGIAASDWGPLTQISSIKFQDNARKIILADLSMDLVPEKAVALNSFDVIILNDVDTSNLTEAQQLALSTWVQEGGFLVIGGGTGLEKTISGLPESLTTFEVKGYANADNLPTLETIGGGQPILVSGPFTVADIGTSTDTNNPTEEGPEILYQWTLGKGKINLVSLNLTDAPFNAWSGTPAFWESLLEQDAYFPMWMPRDMSLRQMRASNMYYPLSNLPALDLPSIKGLGILMIVYILIIGPTNYLILKSKKKLHLAWVTIPVLTVVFAAGAFGLAYGLRGNDIVTNKLSVISLNADGYAKINSYIGVFSPAQDSYEIEVDGDILLSPTTSNYYDAWSSSVSPTVGETIFMQENPAKVIGLEIGQWSMQTFNSENSATFLGKIDANLTLSGDTISGEILNQMDYPVKDAAIIIGNNVIAIGDLEPNQTESIESTFNDSLNKNLGNTLTYQIMDAIYPTGSFDYQRDYELKRSMLDNTFQPYGYWVGPDFEADGLSTNNQTFYANVYLLGWVESTPPDVSINGKESSQNTLGLITTHIPLAIATGDYALPSSLLEGTITKQPLNGGYCGSTTTHIYLDFGSAEFEFNLPPALLETDIEQLLIGFQEDISQWSNEDPGISVSIYDWENDHWSVLSNISNGVNAIENNSAYISPAGIVRIQVEKEAQNVGGCILVSVGLEGSQP